jgi:very-short-patch-repair endonuclease
MAALHRQADKKVNVARSLRQRGTELEHQLWRRLRGRQVFGLKFRRQHPIGRYVVDFACPEAKIAVEIDGYWHTQRSAADDRRAAEIQTLGYHVVRFDIERVPDSVEVLAEAIVFAVRERLKRVRSDVPPTEEN